MRAVISVERTRILLFNMYCPQQYPYPTEHQHQQHSASSIYGLPLTGYSASNYGSTTPYSPPADRPSPPSFRIEDLLVQSRNGHFPTYTSPFSAGFPSASPSSHGYSYRAAHGHHQHENLIGMPVTMHSCGAASEKDHQGKFNYIIVP